MRGITAERQGAPFQVSNDLELPEPAANQILVKSIYTAINPVDHMMVDMGILVDSWPFVPGCDAAGVVVKTGSEAGSIFKVGDEVCGCTRLGMKGYSTCQEYFLMDAPLTMSKPKNLSLVEAATIGVGIETAALGVFGGCQIPLPDPEALPVLKDEWAVVLGGASNVGRFGIQLFKVCGYKVIASCGVRSVETVKAAGADVVFDYKTSTTEQVTEVLNHTKEKVHHVFDAAAMGYEFARELFKQLPEGPKYFATTNDWSGITDFEGGHTYCIQLGLIGRDDGAVTNQSVASYIPVLTRLFELGKLVPPSYTVIGDGGFDAALEGFQHHKSASSSSSVGSTKVVVKIQDM